MRGAAIVSALVLAASVADAKETDWSGTWDKEGGGSVAVKLEKGRYLLDAAVPVDGAERSVSFAGPRGGEDLALEGAVVSTRGMARALGGEKADGRSRPCQLAGRITRDGDTESAAVRYRLDGAEVRSETWRRKAPLLEIVELRVDGEKLSGSFDPKLARKGLEVRYRLRGSQAVALVARILVRPLEEKYPGFYKGPRVHEEKLGTIEPGERSFTWDGRDDTSAARLVLEGCYDVEISATPKQRATERFTVAAPRFTFMSWKWGTDKKIPAPDSHASDVQFPMKQHGYAPETSSPGDRGLVARTLARSAFVVMSSHGDDGSLYLYTGDPSTPTDLSRATAIRSMDVGAENLRDMHVAIVSGCAAAKSNLGDPGIAQALVDAGCDVALGFETMVWAKHAIPFQVLTLALLERGASIEKAARDGARAAFRVARNALDLTDAEIDAEVEREKKDAEPTRSAAASLVVKRAKNGSAEDETFWPPRYGNSKN